MTQDEQHLQLLAIFHYVVAGFAALFSLFPLIHLILGVAMVTGRLEPGTQDPMASWVGWLFISVAVLFILCGLTFSGLLAWAGRSLDTRRHYTFCMVMAALACAFFPFGTILGVFTLIVLSRPSVRELFRPGPAGTRAERSHA